MYNVFVTTTSCVALWLGDRTSLRVRVIPSRRATSAANRQRFRQNPARDENAHANGHLNSKEETRRELQDNVFHREKEEEAQHEARAQASRNHKRRIANDGDADAG